MHHIPLPIAIQIPGQHADLTAGSDVLIGLARAPIHYDFLLPMSPDLRARYGFAEAAGVPIFRNVPLARQLYADCDLDDYVPDELFGVIAEILAWVQRNEAGLYSGPLGHGDLDMERGDHRLRPQH